MRIGLANSLENYPSGDQLLAEISIPCGCNLAKMRRARRRYFFFTSIHFCFSPAHRSCSSPATFLPQGAAVCISLDLDRISAAAGVWVSLTASLRRPLAGHSGIQFRLLLNSFSMSAQLALRRCRPYLMYRGTHGVLVAKIETARNAIAFLKGYSRTAKPLRFAQTITIMACRRFAAGD